MKSAIFRHELPFFVFGYEKDQFIDLISKVPGWPENIYTSLHEYAEMQASDFRLLPLSDVKCLCQITLYDWRSDLENALLAHILSNESVVVYDNIFLFLCNNWPFTPNCSPIQNLCQNSF
jgi:hypothetical protein